MESTIPNTFCPDEIFDRLNTYITQVQLLDHVQVSNLKKISSRTLGLISLSEKLGQQDLEFVKDGTILYSARKTDNWKIFKNELNYQQISLILKLPQTKEQIFFEFYSRQLTLKLKEIFQSKCYPINQKISLNHAQVPYSFYISAESTSKRIIFIGTDSEDNIVFRSFFDKDDRIDLVFNEISLEQTNRLCSSES